MKVGEALLKSSVYERVQAVVLPQGHSILSISLVIMSLLGKWGFAGRSRFSKA